jgi:hypothetical protein
MFLNSSQPRARFQNRLYQGSTSLLLARLLAPVRKRRLRRGGNKLHADLLSSNTCTSQDMQVQQDRCMYLVTRLQLEQTLLDLPQIKTTAFVNVVLLEYCPDTVYTKCSHAYVQSYIGTYMSTVPTDILRMPVYRWWGFLFRSTIRAVPHSRRSHHIAHCQRNLLELLEGEKRILRDLCCLVPCVRDHRRGHGGSPHGVGVGGIGKSGSQVEDFFVTKVTPPS